MASVARLPVESFGLAPKGWGACNICLDEKNEELKGHQAGKTQHKYHKSCLNSWLEKNSSCPDCRQPLASRHVKVLNAEQTLVQLELHFPGILNAPKEYLQEANKHLKISVPLACLTLTIMAINSAKIPFELSHVVSGGIVGFSASYIFRNMTAEAPIAHQYENDLERMSHIIQSKPFIGALIGSTALGVAVSTGSFLLTSLPIFIAGIGVRYGIEKLHENEYLSEETKEGLQKAVTIASSAFALVSPIKAVASLVLGGFLGATVEAHFASNRVQDEGNQ